MFGFTERLRAGDSHAQLAMGQGGILLGQKRTGPDGLLFAPPRPGEVSVTLTIQVEDLDRHYEHAKQRGARIVQPPDTHRYGERQYSAMDLEGYRWAFSQSVADVKPEDWGARAVNAQYPAGQLPRPRWCYIEIPAADLRKSVAFYEAVFSWNIRKPDSDSPSFDDATGNISGAWVTGRPASREAGMLSYIWVDSIDATVALIQANGGEMVRTPHRDAPEGEWIATFLDPAGNLLGLYQEGKR